jgi:hypothetical protein
LGLRGRKMRKAREDCIMRSFITCTLRKYYQGDKVKEDEMGRRCSTYGRDEKFIVNFCWKTWREETMLLKI